MHPVNQRLAVFAVTLAVVGAARTARAATCTINSPIGVAFGTYDVFETAPVDSVGSIIYRCTGVGVTDTVTVEIGAGGGTFAQRTMRHGADALSYNLYTDASLTTVFGDGSSGTSRYGPVTPAEDVDVTVSVYGRVPARQDARVGAYTDTVTVTITF